MAMAMAIGRRGLIGVAATVAVGSSRGAGVPFSAADFGTVGVFGLDWLNDPAFGRLLDNLAASPGGVRGVRAFGVLSGGRDRSFPTSSADVWEDADAPPDFSRALRALDALVSRGLVPFLPLTFFPRAVAPRPIDPPADFDRWRGLVRAFLDAAVYRFDAPEVGRWWFEVWNEPNMPPFWSGSFERYLDLYRATSEVVTESGYQIRLGGPAIAYLPEDGPALIERFLRFLRDEPAVRCDFVSYHRKGIWSDAEAEPQLGRLLDAAERTALAVRAILPEQAAALTIVNDEADMKVGFDRPYPPRMTAQSASWLAASMIAHQRLGERLGVRFVVASDNANLQLARGPFDGRRMLMTPLSSAPADQVKLPVLGFYELLRLLNGSTVAAPVVPESVACLATSGEHGIAVLLTRYDASGAVAFDCMVRDIPWRSINVVQFRIDAAHTNAARGAPDARQMRLAQELGVLAPPRHGVRVAGELREQVRLGAFETAVIWITPHARTPPESPGWLEATRSDGLVVLRWEPDLSPALYGYDLLRDGRRISPAPLRAAMWTDSAAPAERVRYAVRAVSASGIVSAATPVEPV